MSAKLFIKLLVVLSDLTIVLCGAIIIYSIYYLVSHFITRRYLCKYIRRKTRLKRIIEYVINTTDVNLYESDDSYIEFIINYVSYIIEHIVQSDSKLKFKRFYNITIINNAVTHILYKVKKYQSVVDYIYEYYESNFDEFQFEVLLRKIYNHNSKNKNDVTSNKNDDVPEDVPSDIAIHMMEYNDDDMTNISQAINDFLD